MKHPLDISNRLNPHSQAIAARHNIRSNHWHLQKALILFMIITIASFTLANAQSTKQVAKSPSTKSLISRVDSNTYVFKTANEKPIDLRGLNDGKHSFTAKDGNRMVIELKSKKVASIVFYAKSGQVIIPVSSSANSTSKKIEESIKDSMASQCQACSTITYPDGNTQTVCTPVNCPDAQTLQNSISGPASKSN